ncbi:MAG: hypothetical protein F6K42_21215 [Leptolyngbya sp. SIO1D8]|nr:hypothetical protein [Leptolyngbya sp. SIO1D8]
MNISKAYSKWSALDIYQAALDTYHSRRCLTNLPLDQHRAWQLELSICREAVAAERRTAERNRMQWEAAA